MEYLIFLYVGMGGYLCYLAIKKLAMSFEHELIKKVVGEELYHELCTELGGLQMSFKKGNKESVFYYYNKGMHINEIVSRPKKSLQIN